jgi:Holliday junction resolvase RusA-like endonuclease
MTTDLADELLGTPLSHREQQLLSRKWRLAIAPTDAITIVKFTIQGEPASKANSRKVADVGPPENRRRIFIKSEKARRYARTAQPQIPLLPRLIEGPVAVTIRIWYASARSDLDESLILDAMQLRVYKNDRQVHEKHIYHGIDKENPRAEVMVQAMVAQQVSLL